MMIVLPFIIGAAIVLPIMWLACRNAPDEHELWPGGADETWQAAKDRLICDAIARETSKRNHPSWQEPS